MSFFESFVDELEKIAKRVPWGTKPLEKIHAKRMSQALKTWGGPRMTPAQAEQSARTTFAGSPFWRRMARMSTAIGEALPIGR